MEAICFEKEHSYLPGEQGGYTCQSCHKNITAAEFEKRSKAENWVDGLAPLKYCHICNTWHVPQDFDINSQLRITYMERRVEISDMKNGRFAFASDHDESGYVTAIGWHDALRKIKHWFQVVVQPAGPSSVP